MTDKPYAPAGGWGPYQKKRRERHKAHGLCIYCTQEAEPNEQLCQRHKDYHTVYKNAKRPGSFKRLVVLTREENAELSRLGPPEVVMKEAGLLAARKKESPDQTLSRVAKGLFK